MLVCARMRLSLFCADCVRALHSFQSHIFSAHGSGAVVNRFDRPSEKKRVVCLRCRVQSYATVPPTSTRSLLLLGYSYVLPNSQRACYLFLVCVNRPRSRSGFVALPPPAHRSFRSTLLCTVCPHSILALCGARQSLPGAKA